MNKKPLSILKAISRTIPLMVKQHHYIRFLDLPETTSGAHIKPDFNSNGIVASGVSFAYPHARKLAVDGVNLTIYPGETIAIVGENGSGKSTLVKLLCGLYKPASGTITVGGQDTAQTADRALFANTSAVFQNHVNLTGLTLGENVKLGDYTCDKDVVPALMAAEEGRFQRGN